MTERTFTVKIDPSLHSREPETGSERLHWEVLDTVWGLLREYAVRITIQSMREAYQEKGLDFPETDEEMFEAGLAETPEAPRNHLDLAPGGETVDLAAMGLDGAFRLLLEAAMAEAREGLEMGDQAMDEIDRLVNGDFE